MNSAFDTLTALRSLEASGLESTHAEAIVQVVSQRHEQVATKADVARLQDEFIAFREETKAGFAALRQDFRQEMKEGFAASRKEWKEELAAFRREIEGILATQRRHFQAELSSTVNRMLLAQVAVGGLVVAVLRLL